MGKVFCLPFNGDVDFTIEYARENHDRIYEFYGTDGLFHSATYGKKVDDASFRKCVSVLQGLDIKFNYLLNAIGIDDYIAREGMLFRHLDSLRPYGVSMVTLSHPAYVSKFKSMGFCVSSSIVQDIKTIPEVKWVEKFGYDRVICSDNLNRQISQLGELLTATVLPVEIIVNNICLPSCPLRHSHYSWNNMLSFACSDSYASLKEKRSQIVKCREMWKEDPILFLKSSWIRPEDIARYLNLGVSLIKIGGRDVDSDRLSSVFDIYLSGNYKGCVLDYLEPHTSLREDHKINDIRNEKLDFFFASLFANPDLCAGNCHTCTYCDDCLAKLLSSESVE